MSLDACCIFKTSSVFATIVIEDEGAGQTSLDTRETLERASCPLVDDASRIAIPRIISMVGKFLQDAVLERIHDNIHLLPDLATAAFVLAVPGIVVFDTDVEEVSVATACREIDLEIQLNQPVVHAKHNIHPARW